MANDFDKVNDSKLVEEADKGLRGQGAVVESMRRLREVIVKLDKTTALYSKILITLTVVLVTLSLLPFTGKLQFQTISINKEKTSSIISLIVAMTILFASYFQWWNLTYNGKMVTKKMGKNTFCNFDINLISCVTIVNL